MTKHFLPKVEFYITNVCNLTCDGCNRFNNFNFSGWQRWSDHEQEYQQWAQHVEIGQAVILGGEPLLNPDILEWVRGINQVFGVKVQILTNGTRINKVKGLYEFLRNNGNWLSISWHNPNKIDEIDAEVRQFLKEPVTRIDGPHVLNKYHADIMWMDRNGIIVPMWSHHRFYQSSVISNSAGGYTLHNSDPKKAHDNCGFAKYKNYHFIRGKLYKCGPVALFPEFDQQFHFDLSDQDRALMNAYRPLCADEFETRGAEFLANLDQPLAQCKFCPVSSDFKIIASVSKKDLRFAEQQTG
jgi:Radical SAM superfamily/4Fe-4S single cluster domain